MGLQPQSAFSGPGIRTWVPKQALVRELALSELLPHHLHGLGWAPWLLGLLILATPS